MDRNWDTETFDNRDLDEAVAQIHLCAYINESNEGDVGLPPTNHWATFLEISDKHSVRIDMAPGYGSDGLRGKIQVSTKLYRYTSKSIYYLTIQPTANTRVKDILDVIMSKGRQKYNFTPEWEGCRFWIYTLISDLEAQGIVGQGSADATWNAVSYYFRNPSGHEIREVRQGTFRSTV